MTLVSLSNVRVDFGATTIVQDVTFTVARGERWGVVGRNGAGKTTIFRVITGEVIPVDGAVAKLPGLKVALLDQQRDYGGAVTVWEAAASGYREVIALERSLQIHGEELAKLGDRVSQADIERYGHEQERFAHAGGYDYHAKVDAVLQGLGFDPADAHHRALASLSGGERGRLGLAAQLAAPADLILLDEPTNHLDLDTTRWLTEFLASYDGTVMMISHDRAFLDESVDHVLHVSSKSAAAYRGGYSAFVTQRAERQLALERRVEQQRKFIEKEEDYIRRNIAGQNTAQAKGRRTRLARLPRLSPPPSEGSTLSWTLEISERGGDQVLVADQLSNGVDGRALVRGFSASVRRGDVIALVGPNRAGRITCSCRRIAPSMTASRTSVRCGRAAGSRTTSAISVSPASRCVGVPRRSAAASAPASRSRCSRSVTRTSSCSTNPPTIWTSRRSRRSRMRWRSTKEA